MSATEIYVSVIALVAALGGLFGLWLRGWLQGKADSDRRHKERDHERSKALETAADRARKADDAGHVLSSAERLRNHGRLRD
jgi:hypothetical protein